MKTLQILLSILILNAGQLCAGEKPVMHTYHGEVAGVVCSACAARVKTALSSLPGVQSVKIKTGNQPGVGRLEIISSSAALTREAAVKALGEAASHYDIRSLGKVAQNTR